MKEISLKIPESLNMNAFDVAMLVASKLYDEGKLSSGQAAEMVGLSKRAFIEVLGKYNVSVFGYDIKDIENDLRNV